MSADSPDFFVARQRAEDDRQLRADDLAAMWTQADEERLADEAYWATLESTEP